MSHEGWLLELVEDSLIVGRMSYNFVSAFDELLPFCRTIQLVRSRMLGGIHICICSLALTPKSLLVLF